jgi:cobalt-zinc-cadmium efflux system outer membrane protein
MTTFRQIATFTVFALGCAATVRGQDAGPPFASAPQYVDEREGISLDDAIARAIEREPSLRAARADIDVARGMRQQAALRRNPTLSLEQREEPAGTDAQTSIGVDWPLDIFRRRSRLQTAERELQATQFAVADRERLVVGEVRTRYGAAAAAVREFLLASELVATAKRQVDVVSARVQSGATPPLERDLLEVELSRFEADRLLAAGHADAAFVQLKQVLGMPPDQPLLLRETLEGLVGRQSSSAEATPPSLTPPTTRPDVREAEARVSVADARIDQARREGRVDVTVFGTYMRTDAGFPQQGVGSAGVLERVRGRFHYAAAGAMVVLPLFNRNQGQVSAAQAERTGAEARRDALTLAVRAEVAAAQARDAQAQRALGLYNGGMRSLARQNLDVVRETFNLGRATVFDVLAELRRYVDLEQAYTRVLREAWEARAELQRALGDRR